MERFKASLVTDICTMPDRQKKSGRIIRCAHLSNLIVSRVAYAVRFLVTMYITTAIPIVNRAIRP